MGKITIKKKSDDHNDENIIDNTAEEFLQEEVIDEVKPIEEYDKFAGLDVEVSSPATYNETPMQVETIVEETSYPNDSSNQPPTRPPAGQGYQEYKASKRAIADIQSNPGWIKRILFMTLITLVPSLVSSVATIIPFVGVFLALAIALVGAIPVGYGMTYGAQYAMSRRNTMLPEHVVTLENFFSGLKAAVVALVLALIVGVLSGIIFTPILLAGVIAPLTKGMSFVGIAVGLIMLVAYTAIMLLFIMFYYYCSYKVALSGRIRDGLNIFKNIGEMRSKHYISNALIGPVGATIAIVMGITIGVSLLGIGIAGFSLGASGMYGVGAGSLTGLVGLIPVLVISLVAAVFIAFWNQRLCLIAFRAIAHEDIDEV